MAEISIMAYPNTTLIQGLRNAATQLRKGAYYAWGHHGACNCGHLLQATTQFSKEEIVSYAHTGRGEWTELAEEACSISGAPFNLLIHKLEQLGLTTIDIHNIEYLGDRQVLNHLPGGFRWLQRNVREDVILYFETMAGLLEDKLHHDLKAHSTAAWTVKEPGENAIMEMGHLAKASAAEYDN